LTSCWRSASRSAMWCMARPKPVKTCAPVRAVNGRSCLCSSFAAAHGHPVCVRAVGGGRGAAGGAAAARAPAAGKSEHAAAH
jgi:hypothetical protein